MREIDDEKRAFAEPSMPFDPFCIIHPSYPAPGILAALARQSKLDEIREYESKKQLRLWSVRGVISDSVPLSGGPAESIARPPQNLIFLNEDPLSIYLHSGGRRAIYYDLVGGSDHKLQYIEVRVESKLPGNAIMLARQPLNALLDVFARDFQLPLCLQRLDLVSPNDGEILITQMLLPAKDGLAAGPMGGIIQAVPFAPYDAIYREALTSTSPFYRLLCAARMYEGTNSIRKALKQESLRRGVQEKLPSEIEVDPDLLRRLGLGAPLTTGVRTTQDLFHKLKDLRDAVAHFLIEREGADIHVYLADGIQLAIYSSAAAALLHYAHETLEQLRHFYSKYVPRRGSMLVPMVQNKDQFVVKASEFGLE